MKQTNWKEQLKENLNSRGWVEMPYKEAEALFSNLIEQVIEDAVNYSIVIDKDKFKQYLRKKWL